MRTYIRLREENPALFKGFLAISLLYALAAYFSSGFYHWDEYFQILEFTAYKWGKTDASSLAWEYEAAMRPWLQSFLIYPGKVIGPHLTVFLARLITGQIFLLLLLKWYFVTREKFQLENTTYFLGTFLLWFFPTLLVRYSSETLSALFIMAFLISYIQDSRSHLNHVLMGIFAALAFWCRYQVGIFLFFPLFHIIFLKRNWYTSLALAISFLIVCSLMIGVDSWGYGSLTFTPYNYFYQNIILKKTSQFGVNAWWDYLKWIIARPTPLIGIPLIIATFFFMKENRKSALAWGILAFIVIHHFIPHKELRFLFPLLPLIPLILWTWFKRINAKPIWIKTFLILNILLIPSFLTPLHPIENFSKNAGNKTISVGPGPLYPNKLAGGLKATYFYNKSTHFTEGKSSTFKFLSKVGLLREALKDDQCQLIYSSRPFFETQINLGILKDKKKLWSLIKC